MDIDAALRSTDELIADRQKKVQGLMAELEQLTEERAALRAARDRWRGAPADEPSALDVAIWRKLGRSEAVMRVFHEHGDAVMTNTEILNALRARGRDGDTANYVAATLQHLKKYEQVAQHGRGHWSLTEAEVKSP